MKVHFLGIGGSGASAAAALAEAQGFEITGCDLEPNNEFTTEFTSSQLLKGHSASHLRGGGSNIDILAITPAITSLDPDNPELTEAKKRKIPILTWQQFLGEYLTKDKFVIAICGTHGKTTTTAMIAQMLEDAKLDPTVELGAIHPKWETNYRISKRHPELDRTSYGTGSIKNNTDSGSKAGMTEKGYFVIEADEFNDNFLHLKPDIAVVTNIEMDHPEYFKDFAAYKDSFKKFLLQTKSNLVANLKDPAIAEIMKGLMKETGITCFDYSNNHYKLKLKVPGKFNQLNAAAAFQVGLLLQIDPSIIRKSLENYTGVGRRFEFIGEFKGAKIYSDFGHHPTEIKVTMEAARQKFPDQRIILIYQPHMFSRTKALFDDFVKVFKDLPVDKIIITDIYPSREVDTGIVSSQQLVDAVGNDTLVYHSKDQVLPMLKHHIQNGDIIFFMGAGDIDKMARELFS